MVVPGLAVEAQKREVNRSFVKCSALRVFFSIILLCKLFDTLRVVPQPERRNSGNTQIWLGKVGWKLS